MTDELLALIGGKEEFDRKTRECLKRIQADLKKIREAEPEALTFSRAHAAIIRVIFPSFIARLIYQDIVLIKAHQSALAKIVTLQVQIGDMQDRLAALEAKQTEKATDPGNVVLEPGVLRQVASA